MNGFEKPFDAEKILETTSVYQLMPSYKDIPNHFKNGDTMYNKLQADWFFAGLKNADNIVANINLRARFKSS